MVAPDAVGDPGMTSEPWASVDEPARAIFESAHDAYVSMDAGGFVVAWNSQAEATFGWSREEAIGRVLSDTIIPPRYRAAHLAGLQRFLDTGDGPVLYTRFEIEALHRDGYEFPVEITITPQALDQSHVFHAFLHDITERRRGDRFKAAQQATTAVLAEAETVAEAIPRLLSALGETLGWDFGAHWAPTDAGVLRSGSAWTRPGLDLASFEQTTRETAFGPERGLPGRVWSTARPMFISDLSADPGFERAPQAAAVGLGAGVGLPLLDGDEVRGVLEFFALDTRRPDPETIEQMEALAAQVGRFLTILSERSKLRARLEQLSLTDELTGLPNRRAWNEGLRRELARASRSGEPTCVALLDLDHFKAFNDEHGHPAGDALLTEVGGLWSASLRATDLLARYGGEEFVIAFSASPLDVALAVVDRVRGATPRGLTCSAGLAAWRPGESPEELVARADGALYEAKRGGRDRTVTAR